MKRIEGIYFISDNPTDEKGQDKETPDSVVARALDKAFDEMVRDHSKVIEALKELRHGK